MLYKIDPGSESEAEFFDAANDAAALVKAKTYLKDYEIKEDKGEKAANAVLIGKSKKNKLWKIEMSKLACNVFSRYAACLCKIYSLGWRRS